MHNDKEGQGVDNHTIHTTRIDERAVAATTGLAQVLALSAAHIQRVRQCTKSERARELLLRKLQREPETWNKQHAQTARESNNNTDLEHLVLFVSGFVLFAFVVCDIVLLSFVCC
jgi:hypothetical protein